MSERTWGSKYRSTVVCVDAYENRVPVGRISNPYLNGPSPFHGVVQFLRQMEALLDDMRLPQAFDELRSFSAGTDAGEAAGHRSEPPAQTGALATFLVSIIFRQNASWQGVVTWLDTGREENFRSTLELLTLIDSALSA